MTLVPLAAATNADLCGGKASWLAKGLAAGLPIPDGFVVLDARVDDSLDAHLRKLGSNRFAVRSSSTLENRPGTQAAGLLSSFLDVPAEEVVHAIRAVRASSQTRHVRDYLEQRGLSPSDSRVAVLIQPMLTKQRWGFAASGSPPIVEAYDGWSTEPEAATLDAELLAAVEKVVGGAAEIEWVDSASQTWIVQLRPKTPEPADGFELALSDPADAETSWRLDAEHNPDPLSPAHESIVATLGDSMRVINGYLYSRQGRTIKVVPPANLARFFRDEIVAPFEREIAPLEDPRADKAPELLESALELLRRFANGYEQVQRAIGQTRADLIDFVRRHFDVKHSELLLSLTAGIITRTVARDQELWQLGRAARAVSGLLGYLAEPTRPAAPSEEMADWFSELRAHLDHFGAYAPAWDVSSVTYSEDPRPLYSVLLGFARSDRPSPEEMRQQSAQEAAKHYGKLRAAFPTAIQADLARLVEVSTANLAIAEEDDLLFARALRAIRRPITNIGRGLAAQGALDSPEDVFFLPIDTIREPNDHDLRAIAARNRHRDADRRRLVAPTHFKMGRARFDPPSGSILTGAGIGGRARGPARVVRNIAQVARDDVADSILVVPVVMPTMTFLLAQVAGLVTDHGGLLDHGACQAREYGLAAVVGTRHATRQIQDGEILVVDGLAGRVYRKSD